MNLVMLNEPFTSSVNSCSAGLNFVHINETVPSSGRCGRFDFICGEFGAVGVNKFQQEITMGSFGLLFNVLLKGSRLVWEIGRKLE